MKLLVTGATGFLGSTLVPLLLEQGHSVRALQRGEGLIAGAEVLKGDVRDEATIRKALKGIEGVYHLAGLVSVAGRYHFDQRWVGQLSWNRVVTDYHRDADVLLLGLGATF